jgi:hypothetical protein
MLCGQRSHLLHGKYIAWACCSDASPLMEPLVELGGEVEREAGEVDHVRGTLTVTESVTDVTVEMDVCKLVQRRDAAQGSESRGGGTRSGGGIHGGGGGGEEGEEAAEAEVAVVVKAWEAETEPEEAEGRGRGGRGCVVRACWGGVGSVTRHWGRWMRGI